MSMYDNMKFGDYEFHEYPKWVTPEGGAAVLVNNEDEELTAMMTGESPVDEAAEKARLILLGEVNGVQIDKKWGIARMAKVITDAGHDASVDPRV